MYMYMYLGKTSVSCCIALQQIPEKTKGEKLKKNVWAVGQWVGRAGGRAVGRAGGRAVGWAGGRSDRRSVLNVC